jgi:tRNA threonylcarbamoyladenosine biosynthesis protein TsaB
VLTIAFDTATSVVTSALVEDEAVLAERVSRPVSVLEDLELLLREAELEQAQLSRVVVGIGPGSFTGIRTSLAVARSLSFALGIPVAGVSTLAALAAGAPGALPVIDAKRKEVFVALDEPRCLAPADLELEPGTRCVGDGAVRYRTVLEAKGAEIPPDDSPLHVPWARTHAALAHSFGPADEVEPIYLRPPDAEKAV